MFDLRLSLVADRVNRQILGYLSERPQYPEDLARRIGFTRSALEQRLARLIEAGFVRKLAERDTQRVVLLITPEAEWTQKWLEQLHGLGSQEKNDQELKTPVTTPTAVKETEHLEPTKTRGFLERLSLPWIVFLIFETIAIVNSYYQYIVGAWNWVVIGWVIYTALGVVAAKFTGWLTRLGRKRVNPQS